MGKTKIKKRVSFQKQFSRSFILILLSSLLATLLFMAIFYSIYHKVSGFDSSGIGSGKLTDIVEYTQSNGTELLQEDRLRKLKSMLDQPFEDFYILDLKGNILFRSETLDKHQHTGFIRNVIYDSMDTLKSMNNVQIPIVDQKTAAIRYRLVLNYHSRNHSIFLSMVDMTMPFLCVVLFTLFFARRLSRKMGKPIRELMGAAEKIKDRDLDFAITYEEENEIGDLARALENMRKELQAALEREWKLEQDRREMVAALTHDIRTPLAIIQGHVEGLQDGMKLDAGKLDEYLDIIRQNTDRARKLVDEMNSLSEVDSVDFAICPSAVDFAEFLRNKLKALEPLALHKQIQLNADIKDHRQRNAPVMMDADRLSQVIDNIIGNSIRFTPANGSIHIDTGLEDEKTIFRISDTGPGFSDQDISAVFKKFYKGDPSRSREKGHSGLGLYIAKSIVEKHGGTITAYNLAEGGACIEMMLEFPKNQ